MNSRRRVNSDVMRLTEIDALSEIRVMWENWKTIPFPAGYAGKEVAGICVTSVDTFAAGCIDTFIASKGRLDAGRISILKQCKNDLEVVLDSLEGDAKTYFNHLLLLSKSVLQFSGR